jgi:hypothetical protein
MLYADTPVDPKSARASRAIDNPNAPLSKPPTVAEDLIESCREIDLLLDRLSRLETRSGLAPCAPERPEKEQSPDCLVRAAMHIRQRLAQAHSIMNTIEQLA